MQSRPELGLTADGRAYADQQEKAVRALTEDNGAALRKAGFESSHGNLYMAHFLGAGGATQFLAKMKENPDADASKLFPKEAAANPTIFNGRTLAQVYALQTKRFQGNGPQLFTDDQLLPSYQSQNAPRDYTFMNAMSGALRHETALGIIGSHVAAPSFTPETFEWTPTLQKEKLGEFDEATQEYIRNTAVSLGHVDWRGVEQELRDEAKKLPKQAKDARARLRKEADEIKDFHNKLLSEAEDAWAEAVSHYKFKPQKMAQAEARIERDTRLASLDKKTQKTIKDERASINEQRDTRIQGVKERSKQLVEDRMQAIQARFFQEAFAKRMAKFEDKFVRRVARKYVETVNNSIEGIRADVDRALSVRDTQLLREALKREGVVAELVLRHGFEAFQRGVPSMRQIADTIKQGGPEVDAIVRDLQVFAGVGVKGQEARIIPKFRGLDSELADSVTGTRLVKMMRLSKGLANAVGHASGLNVLTDVQHMAAARIFLQTVADVARGTRKADRRLLADMGLDEASLKRFWGVLQHAKFDKDGVIEDLNSQLLRTIDLKAFDELMGATRREAFRTILEPNPGLLPMWAGSSVTGKFFWQLKTFSAAANAVHTIGNWRLGPAYVAKSVVGGAAWAFAMYSLWTHVKALGKSGDERSDYLEKAFAPDKLAFNIWSRVGMAGLTPELLGGGLATAQRLGLAPADTQNLYGQSARASGLVYGSLQSFPVLSMMGVLMDSLQTGVDVVKSGRGMTRGEARRLASLLPLQNALGISQALNAATTNLPLKKADAR